MPRPCSRCAAWEKRYDDLLAMYHTLRVPNGGNPHQPARVIPPAPDAASVAMRRAESDVLDGLVADLRASGMTEQAARNEAERIRASGLGSFTQPPGEH